MKFSATITTRASRAYLSDCNTCFKLIELDIDSVRKATAQALSNAKSTTKERRMQAIFGLGAVFSLDSVDTPVCGFHFTFVLAALYRVCIMHLTFSMSAARVLNENHLSRAAKNIFAKIYIKKNKMQSTVSTHRARCTRTMLLHFAHLQGRHFPLQTHLIHLITSCMEVACGKPSLACVAPQQRGLVFHANSSSRETSRRQTKHQCFMSFVVVVLVVGEIMTATTTTTAINDAEVFSQR